MCTEAEVIEFCGSLGLKFTPEEGCQALDEMEMDDTRDGQVTLEEYACGHAPATHFPPERWLGQH